MSENEPRRSTAGPISRNLSWLVPVVAMGGLVIAYFVLPGFQSLVDDAYAIMSSGDEQEVQNWVEQFGGWGFAVILGLMLFQTVVAFLPSLITMVVAVLAYGPLLGGALAWGGMLVAATLGYGIGAAVGPAVIDRFIEAETERKLNHFVERYGAKGIIAARISPVMSTDAVSIVAGLMGMNYLRFLLATGAGTLPLAILVAWLGADVDRLWPGLVAVTVISLVTFVGYVIWDRRRQVS